MGNINKKLPPYYDDYDPLKQYFQVLALPGRVAQSREITQLQTIMLDVVRNLGNVFLRNGSVIEGCQVTVSEDKTLVHVGDGRVYLDGVILPVSKSEVAITGVGVEKIGIKLIEHIIDESTDPTLRDPAQGYDNYDQPGAHRLKKSTRVVVNDEDSALLTILTEGVPLVEGQRPDYDKLEQTLARRTHDESGSYIVEGLGVRVEPNNASYINLVVEGGKAYVLGYELKKSLAHRIPVNRSVDIKKVIASNYIYDQASAKYLLDSNPHVADINAVKGTAAYTENQTLSTNTDAVLLSQEEVVRLTKVNQGTTEFTVGNGPDNGDCYLLRSGSRYYLKWNGFNSPVSGQSYAVAYEYVKAFVKDTDYQLLLENGAHYLEWLAIGTHPLHNTNFTIDYNEYLARKDVVYLDQYGEVHVTQGTPAEYGFELAPQAPVNTLPIAIVHSPPNGDAGDNSTTHDIWVENIGLTRFTMQDIYNLVKRVQKNEYDQAHLTLNDDARQRSTTFSKKGILTDPIVDFSKVDITFNKDTEGEALDPSLPLFDMALNFVDQTATLPIVSHFATPELDTNQTNAKRYDRLMGLPSTGEETVLSQGAATRSFLINPYSMFPQLPQVSVSPAVDTWFEDRTIQVPRSLTNSLVVQTSTRTVDGWWNSTSVDDTRVGSTQSTNVSTSLVQQSAVTFIRQREITVKGKNFPPGLDNIECLFDSRKVALTPVNGTAAGTNAGTVKANDQGAVEAKFTIPAGIRTGVREVVLQSPIKISGFQTSGFSLYQASGIQRTFQQTITTVTTVLLRRNITNTRRVWNTDPLAQTFILDKMTTLKAIEVFFESKSDSMPVVMEIREVENGNITDTLIAEKSLDPAQVATTQNASTPTRFTFDDPVILQENREYAFVLRSASDAYRAWVAELGEKDVQNGNTVIKNPYLQGVMMSSSNNSTWSPHQTMDIKFNVVEEKYANTGTIIFKELSIVEASRLMLGAESVVPQGCDVRWMYQINNDGRWLPILPYALREIVGTFTTIKLKAELVRDPNINLSPLVALDTVSLLTSIYDVEGTYISVNVAGLDPFTQVDVILDTFTPSGTTLGVQVSTDDGKTWVPATLDNAATRNMNNSWKELTYRATVEEDTTLRVRIDATTTSKSVSPKFKRVRSIMS